MISAWKSNLVLDPFLLDDVSQSFRDEVDQVPFFLEERTFVSGGSLFQIEHIHSTYGLVLDLEISGQTPFLGFR